MGRALLGSFEKESLKLMRKERRVVKERRNRVGFIQCGLRVTNALFLFLGVIKLCSVSLSMTSTCFIKKKIKNFLS